jgi:phosphoribosylformylglycinamidine cyclo-ligase
MAKLSYKQAGVDIKKGEKLAQQIKINKQKTLGAFGSFFDFTRFSGKGRKPILVSSADGVGTKIKIAQKLNKHKGLGVDLVAMNVNDIVCCGARPLFFLDYLAFSKLDKRIFSQIINGIKDGLRLCDCELIGGETAEMPDIYKKGEYDLAGFAVGAVDKKSFIDGTAIKENDKIIGISSSGLHSNGFSLVRRIFPPSTWKKYQRHLLQPTRIYVKAILSLLKSSRRWKKKKAIKGIAHITGGAFYNKAAKIVPPGLGMIVDKSSWSMPEIFKIIQSKKNIKETELYSVFNMGIGMIIIVDEKYLDKSLKILNKFYSAYCIGEIVASQYKIKIV